MDDFVFILQETDLQQGDVDDDNDDDDGVVLVISKRT